MLYTCDSNNLLIHMNDTAATVGMGLWELTSVDTLSSRWVKRMYSQTVSKREWLMMLVGYADLRLQIYAVF